MHINWHFCTKLLNKSYSILIGVISRNAKMEKNLQKLTFVIDVFIRSIWTFVLQVLTNYTLWIVVVFVGGEKIKLWRRPKFNNLSIPPWNFRTYVITTNNQYFYYRSSFTIHMYMKWKFQEKSFLAWPHD